MLPIPIFLALLAVPEQLTATVPAFRGRSASGTTSSFSPAVCEAPSTSDDDQGYDDGYRGWYDVQDCGQCNDYCRWVGNDGSGGDPTKSVRRKTSWWSCRKAGTDQTYTNFDMKNDARYYGREWKSDLKKCDGGRGATAEIVRDLCPRDPYRGSWSLQTSAGDTHGELDIEPSLYDANFYASSTRILLRECRECDPQHQTVYYRRLTPLMSHASREVYMYDSAGHNNNNAKQDAISRGGSLHMNVSTANFSTYHLMHTTWQSEGNVRGEDFNLYSTYADAVANKNPWLFCNFDEPGIGFPRDCAPKRQASTAQWQSTIYKYGQKDWAWFLDESTLQESRAALCVEEEKYEQEEDNYVAPIILGSLVATVVLFMLCVCLCSGLSTYCGGIELIRDVVSFLNPCARQQARQQHGTAVATGVEAASPRTGRARGAAATVLVMPQVITSRGGGGSSGGGSTNDDHVQRTLSLVQEHCYICLEPTMTVSTCECGIPVHLECANNLPDITMCTVCHTPFGSSEIYKLQKN